MLNQLNTKNILARITQSTFWIKILFLTIFSVLFIILSKIIIIVTLAQLLFIVFTGSKFDRLTAITYWYVQVLKYILLLDDSRPYPFEENR